MLKKAHKARPIRMARALLNYLVTVPLVHGMRSLMTIIESLELKGGTLQLPKQRGVRERNISRFDEYENPNTVWARIRQDNPVFAKNAAMKKNGVQSLTIVFPRRPDRFPRRRVTYGEEARQTGASRASQAAAGAQRARGHNRPTIADDRRPHRGSQLSARC